MWSQDANFKDRVAKSWEELVQGVLMYRVVKKLQRLKTILRCIIKELFSDIEKEKKKSMEHLKSC